MPVSNVRVAVIPCLRDNYAFLLHDETSGETACVDVPDAAPIHAEAHRRGWQITQVWNTHWHHDHTGGNEVLRAQTGCIVLGPEEVSTRAGFPIDRVLIDDDEICLGTHRARILATPGHTPGHVCFHLADADMVFVGDTLFSAGCGRVASNASQMWTSLMRLRALPERTMVYCGHEYTQANVRFVRDVDGDNPALRAYADTADRLRAAGEPTIPTRLADEMRVNPFLRADDSDLQRAMGHSGDAVATFAHLRAKKDVF